MTSSTITAHAAYADIRMHVTRIIIILDTDATDQLDSDRFMNRPMGERCGSAAAPYEMWQLPSDLCSEPESERADLSEFLWWN